VQRSLLKLRGILQDLIERLGKACPNESQEVSGYEAYLPDSLATAIDLLQETLEGNAGNGGHSPGSYVELPADLLKRLAKLLPTIRRGMARQRPEVPQGKLIQIALHNQLRFENGRALLHGPASHLKALLPGKPSENEHPPAKRLYAMLLGLIEAGELPEGAGEELLELLGNERQEVQNDSKTKGNSPDSDQQEWLHQSGHDPSNMDLRRSESAIACLQEGIQQWQASGGNRKITLTRNDLKRLITVLQNLSIMVPESGNKHSIRERKQWAKAFSNTLLSFLGAADQEGKKKLLKIARELLRSNDPMPAQVEGEDLTRQMKNIAKELPEAAGKRMEQLAFSLQNMQQARLRHQLIDNWETMRPLQDKLRRMLHPEVSKASAETKEKAALNTESMRDILEKSATQRNIRQEISREEIRNWIVHWMEGIESISGNRPASQKESDNRFQQLFSFSPDEDRRNENWQTELHVLRAIWQSIGAVQDFSPRSNHSPTPDTRKTASERETESAASFSPICLDLFSGPTASFISQTEQHSPPENTAPAKKNQLSQGHDHASNKQRSPQTAKGKTEVGPQTSENQSRKKEAKDEVRTEEEHRKNQKSPLPSEKKDSTEKPTDLPSHEAAAEIEQQATPSAAEACRSLLKAIHDRLAALQHSLGLSAQHSAPVPDTDSVPYSRLIEAAQQELRKLMRIALPAEIRRHLRRTIHLLQGKAAPTADPGQQLHALSDIRKGLDHLQLVLDQQLREKSDPKSSADRFSESDALYVGNAGLVLLWPFLSRFWEKIGLMQERTFISEAARQQAVLLLAYLATGETEFPEYQLPLAKLLCGYPLAQPLPLELELDEPTAAECKALLEVVPSHNDKLKNLSAEGFRTAWLQREGVLKAKDDHFVLHVEGKPYDVLLEHMPWSVQMLRMQWMEGILMVEW
jgi:hypothetical protein